MRINILFIAASFALTIAAFISPANAAGTLDPDPRKDSSAVVDSTEAEHYGGSHLFISSTARPLRSGEAYISLGGVVWPWVEVGVGLTDWLTVNATSTYSPLVDHFIGGVPIVVSAKATALNTGELQLAVGGSYLNFIAKDDRSNFKFAGAAYGLATYGSQKRSVTVGIYETFSVSDVYSPKTSIYDDRTILESVKVKTYFESIVVVGGELQVTPGMKFLSENWLTVGDHKPTMTYSGGVRFTSGRFSADVAAVYLPGAGNVSVLPFLRVSHAIGGGK